MQFCEALGLGRGITSIIGSGGKSSLLDRLAEELRERGSNGSGSSSESTMSNSEYRFSPDAFRKW